MKPRFEKLCPHPVFKCPLQRDGYDHMHCASCNAAIVYDEDYGAKARDCAGCTDSILCRECQRRSILCLSCEEEEAAKADAFRAKEIEHVKREIEEARRVHAPYEHIDALEAYLRNLQPKAKTPTCLGGEEFAA